MDVRARPLNYPGILAELVKELPHDLPLRAAKIHTASDGQLVIDTFEFGQGAPFDPHDPDQALKLEQTMGYAALNLPQWSADGVRDYFNRCSADYVLTVTPLRMCNHWELYQRVTGTDGTAVRLEAESDPTQSPSSWRQAMSPRTHAGTGRHAPEPLVDQCASRPTWTSSQTGATAPSAFWDSWFTGPVEKSIDPASSCGSPPATTCCG